LRRLFSRFPSARDSNAAAASAAGLYASRGAFVVGTSPALITFGRCICHSLLRRRCAHPGTDRQSRAHQRHDIPRDDAPRQRKCKRGVPSGSLQGRATWGASATHAAHVQRLYTGLGPAKVLPHGASGGAFGVRCVHALGVSPGIDEQPVAGIEEVPRARGTLWQDSQHGDGRGGCKAGTCSWCLFRLVAEEGGREGGRRCVWGGGGWGGQI